MLGIPTDSSRFVFVDVLIDALAEFVSAASASPDYPVIAEALNKPEVKEVPLTTALTWKLLVPLSSAPHYSSCDWSVTKEFYEHLPYMPAGVCANFRLDWPIAARIGLCRRWRKSGELALLEHYINIVPLTARLPQN
ncbi:MAG: hypothetical protein GY820_44620 [Gammaproteobacteria bacterium]|nr:hypothetical protein [Gammaproteobacteria bacterium]